MSSKITLAHVALMICFVSTSVSTTAAEKRQASSPIVRASIAGAALNADIMKGGGTDDTATLQRVLDSAKNGGRVHLIIDGAALVSGLDVYGNTTIECIKGGGLYLKDRSVRAIIRNAHRSRDAIKDEHIAVRGCFLNGNHAQQAGPVAGNMIVNQGPDLSFIVGLQFFGVNYLTIHDVTLWNIRSFAAHVANASYVDVRNLIVDHGVSPTDADWSLANTDGLHFNGPVRYVTIDGAKFRTADDGLAFNANDHIFDDLTVNNEMGPFVGQGPITDVVVNNIVLMGAVQGMRFLSSTERIDRIVINNVAGTLTGDWLANISHNAAPGRGNVGSISFNNINVSRDTDAPISAHISALVRASKVTAVEEEYNNGVMPIVNINARADEITIRNFFTAVHDARPIIRLGPDAKIDQMTIDLRIRDPRLLGVPLELDAGSHIERLNLGVDWKGNVVDQSKNPIVSFGGTIAQLNWMNTPPQFVSATLIEPRLVSVVLSQKVKSFDLTRGVEIRVNGQTAVIGAAERVGGGEELRYGLASAVKRSDKVTWAYDGAQGALQNLDGDHLLSVAAKDVMLGQ